MLGMEDCFHNKRLRESTLKCNTSSGTLLEINYDDLLKYLKIIDNDNSFIKKLINYKEINKKDILNFGMKRYRISVSLFCFC